MKYLLKVLVVLLIILLSLKLVIHIFDKGHTVSYSVGNFEVSETLKSKSLYDTDDYYFDITHENFKMNFQVPVSYNKAEKVISNIEYYKTSDMNCIMPIFKNGKILTDIMCIDRKNSKTDIKMMTFYHDLSASKKETLEKFVNKLKNKGYDSKKYEDKAEGRKLSNTQTLYDDNFVENHYLAIETYKGLALFNGKDTSLKLFDNDIYTKPVKIFYDKYYIVADYSEEYSFKNFQIVNIINGNISKIRSYDDLSFDSIIQGGVDNDIYFFDPDNETQYKISLKYESVEKVADRDSIKDYNGKWTTMTLNQALDGKKFDKYYAKAPSGFIKKDCLGKKVGYCYYYKANNVGGKTQYMVYRSDAQNHKLLTYLFTTTDMDSVIYLNDYIYFINESSIYYYHDNGIKRVLENKELEFNDDISFGVYVR